MPFPSPSPRLDHLLSRLTDGLLEPAEMAELNELLLRDPEAREHYRLHAAVHLALEDAEAAGKILTLPVARSSRWIMPTLAAAAALVLTTVTILYWPGKSPAAAPTETVDHPVKVQLPTLAVATEVKDVQWSLPVSAASGQSLHRGKVSLASGELSFSIIGGPDVTVRGPAEFELLGSSEFKLISGQAAFATREPHRPFILRLAQDALVDPGSEFSVNAPVGAEPQVRAFKGEVTISTIGESGGTLEEWRLPAGQSASIGDTIRYSDDPGTAFLRVLPVDKPAPAFLSDAYPRQVKSAEPVAYWRFNKLDHEGRVPNEMSGSFPLVLRGEARLQRGDDQAYLLVNARDASGFASTVETLPGLNTKSGVTAECLFYAATERVSTAIALELDGPIPAPRSHHAPQAFLLERTGRTGEDNRHLHPDFALRALVRTPAGYDGGMNLHSREANLLYRWVHAVATSDASGFRLYIDGELSDQIASPLVVQNVKLRPIIGRLQPDPRDEKRQWVGGIDEVALYNRSLSAAEVKAHYAASRR